MPATSDPQAHTARVAMGIKHGDINPHSLPPGLRKAAESMAQMSEAQLKDFMYTKKKRKSLVAAALLCCLLLPTLGHAQTIRGATLQAAQSTGVGTPMTVEGFSLIGLGVIGSAGADRVVTWQGSQDGVNYGGLQCIPLATGTAALTLTVTSTTPLLVRCQVAGLKLFQAVLSGGTTGTVTVTGTALSHQ